MPRVRAVLIAAAAAAACLTTAGPASAATVKLGSDNTVWYKAAPGEANDVTIEGNGVYLPPYPAHSWFVRDTGATLTPGYGCTPYADGVLCQGTATTDPAVDARLGDGDDAIQVQTDSPARIGIYGSSGNDTIFAGGAITGGRYTIDSGGGADDVQAGDGVFSVLTGTGADDLSIGEIHGASTFDTGDGDDDVHTEDYGTATIRLGAGRDVLTSADDSTASHPTDFDGGPGYDIARATSTFDLEHCGATPSCGFEELTSGSNGNVDLYGTAGPDKIIGGPAGDYIDPRGGADVVATGGGDDEVHASGDGAADTVTCGTGLETIFADAIDLLASNCS